MKKQFKSWIGKEIPRKEKEFELAILHRDDVEEYIKDCQDRNHIQQVAFSTYHHALTQICFTCKWIRTSIKREDLK